MDLLPQTPFATAMQCSYIEQADGILCDSYHHSGQLTSSEAFSGNLLTIVGQKNFMDEISQCPVSNAKLNSHMRDPLDSTFNLQSLYLSIHPFSAKITTSIH